MGDVQVTDCRFSRGLVFFAGLIVPSNSPDLLTASTKTGKSPWTIAFTNAGVPQMGHVVNVVMYVSADPHDRIREKRSPLTLPHRITAQLSSMNSALYVASRSLVSLAREGRAPSFFARTTSNGTPANALVFSNLLGLVSMLNYKAGPGKVFNYLITISGSATYIAWAMIGVTHLRFRKGWVAQGNRIEDLPFRALWYPYGTWFVVLLNTFLVVIAGYNVFVGGFHAVDFVINYVVVAVFVVLFCGWKLVKGTKVVPLAEMDFSTGRRDVPAMVEQEEAHQVEKPVPIYIKVKRAVFS